MSDYTVKKNVPLYSKWAPLVFVIFLYLSKGHLFLDRVAGRDWIDAQNHRSSNCILQIILWKVCICPKYQLLGKWVFIEGCYRMYRRDREDSPTSNVWKTHFPMQKGTCCGMILTQYSCHILFPKWFKISYKDA